MKPIHCDIPIILLAILSILLAAPPAIATQSHGPPEGVYVHQFSHIFFIFAMGTLIYWLKSRSLVQHSGWRLIQYAAVFFILWSMDAFLAHFIDEQAQLVEVARVSPWTVRLDSPRGGDWLAWFYYFIKFDHLLCVPGLFFLYRGLKNLSASVPSPESGKGENP